MYYITHLFSILLYTIALVIFGVYITLIEYTDLFNCFMCKEMYELNSTYDYIVVGCGSAGSIVALRLAEDKDASVLVLEAGPHGGRLLDIPAIASTLQLSSLDWQYRTEPQEHAAKALHNNISMWPRGRIVGGSGRLNYMLYQRGHPSDFRDWYKDRKNWNYETEILSYFKKTENYLGSFINDTKYHSSDGPVTVEELSFISPLQEKFLEAVQMLGYPVRDLNAQYNTGFMQSQVTTQSGARSIPIYHIYKHNKPNLLLQTNTLVHRILLKSGYEATAVQYSYLGETKTVRARKAIILSAGAIGTPKILMLSGIGPRDHLSEVGIKTKVDLPVGRNLQDHVTTGLDLILLNTSMGISPINLLSPVEMYTYFYNSTGMWTSCMCEVVGALDTNSKTYCRDDLDRLKLASILRIRNYKMKEPIKYKSGDTLERYLPVARRYKSPKLVIDTKYNIDNEVCPMDETRRPDLGFMVIPVGVSTDTSKQLQKILGLSDVTWYNYFAPLMGSFVATIAPIVLHPKSRGSVQLSGKKIHNKVVINPNYLSDRYDVEILLKGIDLIKQIIATKPMQRLGVKLNERKFPGCEAFEFDTEPYWECYVRHLTMTVFHPVGTCKMGRADDVSAVVGYDFRVHRTNKLYVADASVMPSLTSSPPNAAVMMIGEKVAAEVRRYNYVSRKMCRRKEILIRKRVC